jgi:hypothetical protein
VPLAVPDEVRAQAAHGVVEELQLLLAAGSLGEAYRGFARPQGIEDEPAGESCHGE